MSFLTYQKQSPEFLNNYLKYKRYITFSAGTTVDESYYDLRTLFRYIKIEFYNENAMNDIDVEQFRSITIQDITIEDINKVTQKTLTNFIFFLKYTLDNCPKSRNKKLATLKRFFEYLYINNLISYNPTIGMKSATVEKRVAKHLNLNESKKLLSTALNSDQRYKIRNYTITCLFLNCCLRLSELIQIDLTDLKLDERTLKVHGKGNMERIVYLNDAVLEALTEYLKVRPSLGKDNIDYNALFISSRNKRISKRAVQSIIKEELNMTFDEAKGGLHTHTLRHTGATLMYNENDTNILVLKKVLGHKSIAATEVYTHVDPKKLKDIMENCAISSLLERKEEVMANGRN